MDPLTTSASRSLVWAASFLLVAGGTTGFATTGNVIPATATAAEVAPIPPDYRDAEHVPQGCYISTVVYLARFAGEHPDESGRPLTVVVSCFDGPHTIALITWRGRWWGRDEYSGVFDLRCAVAAVQETEDLRSRASESLAKVAQRQLKNRQISAGSPRGADLSPAQRHAAVVTAATLLSCAAQVYTVTSGRTQIPLLFFRPYPGRIAVYDPASGTGTAVCDPRDEVELVARVAARLGYAVSGIRRQSPGPRVAAVTALAPTRRFDEPTADTRTRGE